MAPMIIGLTVTQINTFADDIIAKILSGSIEKGEYFFLFANKIKYPLFDGAVSHLYYSQRIYQLPLGVFGISLATAIFPLLASASANNEYDKLTRTISRGIRMTIFLALPATAGLLLLSRPTIAAIFQRGEFTPNDSFATATTLCFYAIGLTGFFMQQIVTRAFYAIGDSKTPMRSAILAVIINIILNLSFVWRLGTAGLALSTSLCSYIQVAIMLYILNKKWPGKILSPLPTTIIKTLLSTCVMYLVGALILKRLDILPDDFKHDLIRLVIIVPASALTYWLTAKLIRSTELKLLSSDQQ